MSREPALDRLRVVLVRPGRGENIGAAARAMKNMGVRSLYLVDPVPGWRATARAAAVHAGDVLAGARPEPDLAAAVADCVLVVGTTARRRGYRAAAESWEALAPRVARALAAGPAALVFGPERHGLTTADLSHCHRLARIDTAPAYPSLNLAHAVLLCCYEVRRHARTAVAEVPEPLARAEEVERMFRHLRAALLEIGFLPKDNPDHILLAIRRLLGRADLRPREVRILLGMARQIQWAGRCRRQSAAEAGGPERGER